MQHKIKNIVFDFGDIFIDLDKEAPIRGIFELYPDFILDPETEHMNQLYEKGMVSTPEFVEHYLKRLPGSNAEDLKKVWNSIILNIPEHRISFLESLTVDHSYRLFLLSNTNALHMEQVVLNTGIPLLNKFRSYFEKFYLSHEIHMRKPDNEIYEFVLEDNKLVANETLFIDDLAENTRAASGIGIHTWNLNPATEDVTELFNKALPL